MTAHGETVSEGSPTMMNYDNGGGWFFMSATMIALLAVLVFAGIALYRRTIAPTAVRTDEPYRILAERFARGEIDETEYRDRLSRLRAHDQT
jgi:putative membrane protein